jgi:hypothetical protein
VRPDGRKLLLIQGLAGAETPGLRGSYQLAKDPEVSAPTDHGVKSCFQSPGLLSNSTKSTVGPDGQYLLLIQGVSGAKTPGSRGSYQSAKAPGVSALAYRGVKRCCRPPGLLFDFTSSTVRPDGRYLLLIQSFPGAENVGSRG